MFSISKVSRSVVTGALPLLGHFHWPLFCSDLSCTKTDCDSVHNI